MLYFMDSIFVVCCCKNICILCDKIEEYFIFSAKYVYTVMCLCALAILATIIVLNLHDGSVESPPMWLRQLASKISRIMCVANHGSPGVEVAPESEEIFAQKLREHLLESKKNPKLGKYKQVSTAFCIMHNELYEIGKSIMYNERYKMGGIVTYNELYKIEGSLTYYKLYKMLESNV